MYFYYYICINIFFPFLPFKRTELRLRISVCRTKRMQLALFYMETYVTITKD